LHFGPTHKPTRKRKEKKKKIKENKRRNHPFWRLNFNRKGKKKEKGETTHFAD
jgi:hypothetical protein